MHQLCCFHLIHSAPALLLGIENGCSASEYGDYGELFDEELCAAEPGCIACYCHCLLFCGFSSFVIMELAWLWKDSRDFVLSGWKFCCWLYSAAQYVQEAFGNCLKEAS